ncbi:hypothetical protein TEA_014390 [Camellia sinensis var. sinensis]|uniref:AT-hook motif nuclear-localized protein n=1 Tax=Camellia sinensis var. sinensis TaxID=542762 RepID=A0A4S4ENT5_CAMSN|nr:hypothetical protein TEA_014390 [Camellia sinensis var. sinensis]
MEGKEGINSSRVTVAPESYGMAVRSENPSQSSGSAVVAPVAVTAATPVSVVAPGTAGKKKRGRPKKYGPDGSLRVALSPMPISASIPLTGDFSAWKQGGGRPIDSFKKKHKLEFETLGERVAYSVGANFTPHVITVNAGERSQPSCVGLSRIGSLLEDRGGEFACLQPSWAVSGSTAQDSWVRITVLTELLLARPRVSQLGASHAPTDVSMKVISFSQQGSRAICILSANGAISNVTLRQANSSGGTLTYEKQQQTQPATPPWFTLDLLPIISLSLSLTSSNNPMPHRPTATIPNHTIQHHYLRYMNSLHLAKYPCRHNTTRGRFEILSLTGTFVITDSGGTKSRSGGMSVSLAGPDGRVFGGALAGLLVAAGPVQVVVGSFLPGHHQEEQKPKKQRFEHAPKFTLTSGEGTGLAYGGLPKPNLTPPSSFHGDNVASPNSIHILKNIATENERTLLRAESKDPSPRNCEFSW